MTCREARPDSPRRARRGLISSAPLGLVLALAASAPPAIGSEAPAPAAVVENFALLDHLGAHHELYRYGRDPAVAGIVLFVQGNGCPLVRKRVPQLNALRDRFGPRGILFGMINANPQDTREEIAAEARAYGIGMPILLDQAQLVAADLGLTRTAEALLVNPRGWTLAYRGAMDDRLSYETQRPKAGGQSYLADAIEALLEGRPAPVARTDAPGCKITFPHEGAPPPSFARDVAPILLDHCVRCHRKGGIGPWAMTGHRKVVGWSEMVREVLLTGRMPPWQADPHFGSFANDFSLSAEEKATLVRWIDAGAPRGEGPDPLAAYRPPPERWEIGTPDHVIELPRQDIPAEGIIPYRHVVIDSPFEKDVWVRAVDVEPGNYAALHHVVIHTFTPSPSRRRKQDLRWLSGYAPGIAPDQFPEGTARVLRAGSKIHFELHYTATGRKESDATLVGLYLREGPAEHELHTRVVIDPDFVIPPGAPEHPAEKHHRIRRDILLHTLFPHMHYRGKRMRYTAVFPGGERRVLLSVPNYQFNWQRGYRLDPPVPLPRGSVLHVDAAWDNSAANPGNPDPAAEVRWGEQSFDEMFYASYNFVFDDR